MNDVQAAAESSRVQDAVPMVAIHDQGLAHHATRLQSMRIRIDSCMYQALPGCSLPLFQESLKHLQPWHTVHVAGYVASAVSTAGRLISLDNVRKSPQDRRTGCM